MRRPIKTHLFLLAALLLLVGTATAQRLDVQVEPSRLRVDEVALLRVRILGLRPEDPYQAPIIEAPNFSIETLPPASGRFFRGNLIAGVQWRYLLAPIREGRSQIRVTATVRTRTLERTTTVTVVEPSAEPTPEPSSEPASPPPSRPESSQTENALHDLTGHRFVEAVVEPTVVFVEQQALYRFRYFFESWLPTTESPQYGLPTFAGFATRQLEPLPARGREQVLRNGRRYYVEEIRVVLFPLTPGPKRIPPTELVLPAYAGQSPRILRTQPVQLTVRPLPTPQPPNFSGAVGEFQLRAGLVNDRVRLGEPLRLRVTVSGRGNLNSWSIPPPVQAADAMLYEPTTSLQWDVVEEQAGGIKTFEYVVLPKQAGRLEVRIGAQSYFSPRHQEYRQTEPVVLSAEVLPAGAPPTANRDYPGGSKVSPWKLSALGLVLLAVGAGVLWYRRRSQPTSPSFPPRHERWENQLATLNPADFPNAREFCRELSAQVYRAVAVLMGLPESSAAWEIVERLRADGSPEAALLLRILEQLEAGAYAPGAPPLSDVERLREQAYQALTAYEQRRKDSGTSR